MPFTASTVSGSRVMMLMMMVVFLFPALTFVFFPLKSLLRAMLQPFKAFKPQAFKAKARHPRHTDAKAPKDSGLARP